MPKRVTEPHAVRHPELGVYVVPSPTETYTDDDVLVLAYPWLFVDVGTPDRSGNVETATAAPGEKRSVRVTK